MLQQLWGRKSNIEEGWPVRPLQPQGSNLLALPAPELQAWSLDLWPHPSRVCSLFPACLFWVSVSLVLHLLEGHQSLG